MDLSNLDYERFIFLVRLRMKERQLKVSDVAKHFQLANATIGQILQGRRVTDRRVSQLMNYLDISETDLFFLGENPSDS